MCRRERFRNRRHADRIAAQKPDRADFRRRFKLRTRHEEVDALVDAELRSLCQPQRKLAQARGVHPAHVKEAVAELRKVFPTHRACAV